MAFQMTFPEFQNLCRIELARTAGCGGWLINFRDEDYGREWHATVLTGQFEGSLLISSASASVTSSSPQDFVAVLVHAIRARQSG